VAFTRKFRAACARNLLLFAACSAFLSAPVWAQTASGTIVGTVTDGSGSGIPGAAVSLTNNRTGDHRVVQSSSEGGYEFLNLPPDHYRVEIGKTGFKSLKREDIELQVSASVRVDAALQVGDVSQTIEVTGQTPLLQTETSSLGTVVNARTVQEMPLNGRNVLNLVTLVPGVVAQGDSMNNPTGQNIFAFGNFQIGGAPSGMNATLFDGATLNPYSGTLVALVPTQDSTQEFKVESNSPGPEFGRFAGGVVNMVSKSGSNGFHGTAYEFLRNKALNANTFFNNADGVARGAFTQNQYGANLGGPIKKDKTFFFVGWEGFRLRYGVPFTESVPTLQQRVGDFSNTRTANGQLVPIYDPASTVVNPATGAVTRTQYPNNIIPTSKLNPTALILANYWGKPNAPGLPFTNASNFQANAGAGGNNDQVTARLDHTVSDKQRIFMRYSYWTNLSLAEDPYGNGVYQDRGPETWITNQAVIGDTYMISPTTILDVHAAFLRFQYARSPSSLGTDLTQFGLPASLNSQVSFRVLPQPNVQNFNNIWSSQGAGSVINQANDNYSIYPVITKIQGSHTFKFGGEVRRQVMNYIQSNIGSGYYSFDNLFTAASPTAPTVNGVSTGYGFASFMAGAGSSGSVVTPVPYSYRNYYAGVYFNDSWQVSKKLTVNLGLRWEMPFPQVERYNRFDVLQPYAPSPFAAASGIPNLNGTLGLVSSPANPSRYGAATQMKLFAPRLGLAYRLGEKTVIRAAYGIYYVPDDGPGGTGVTSITQPWASTPDNETTIGTPLNNPFPTGIAQPPQRNPNFNQVLLGTGVSGPVNGAQNIGYTQQWNFGIQRQLADGLSLEIAYAGSKGTHMGGSTTLDQIPTADLSLGLAALNKQVPNPFSGTIPYGTLSLPTIAAGQLLRPYPQYTGVSESNLGRQDYSYNSLQIQAQKRFRQGGTILASYTWSKNIGNFDSSASWLEASQLANIQNNNNLQAERAVSGFDVPQRLLVSYSYDLPFGKGRQFLGGVSGIADKLVSGWGINGISTFQEGFPLTLNTSSNPLSAYGVGTLRPNYTGGCNIAESGSSQQKLTNWFNAACFTQPVGATFGNLGRTLTAVRTAGMANYDFSVFKGIAVTERINVQFRTEFFNIFNRSQFGPPGETLGTAQFGVISSTLGNPRLVQFSLRANF
jgi:Carboxypeptidase regulatory-like domain